MRIRLGLFLIALSFVASQGFAQSSKQSVPGTIAQDLRTFVETQAIPGHEGALAAKIRAELSAYSPQTDNLGDVLVTLGSGAPHRLVVAPMDEPGYVVSRITDDGYLQLQRLPQFEVLPLFNELYSAQPVQIETGAGKPINGVVAGLSVHLSPGRTNPPDPEDIGNMYVDVGAASAAEARRLGVDLLDPMAIDRTVYALGYGKWTSPAIGDRFGDAALVELLRHLDPSKVQGTLTVAFVAEQWAGARGLQRVLDREMPDELVYVGRLLPSGSPPGVPEAQLAPRRDLGSGVLLGESDPGLAVTGLAAELKQLASRSNIPMDEDYSAPLIPRSYLPAPPFPARTVHLGIATAWPSTPGEIIDTSDLGNLVVLLEDYLEGSSRPTDFPQAAFLPASPLPTRPKTAPSQVEILKVLSETYGVSNHEASVRRAVRSLLPPWARPATDLDGNLVLQIASPPAGVKTPRLLVDAHMDEIGYEVKSILPDGRLEVVSEGGGTPYFFLGHAAFVHTEQGIRPGVMELPAGWEKPGFKWTRGPNMTYRVDVGARNSSEAEKLGIKIGDFITIPKRYRSLAGTVANARSFDDRMGCAALTAAAWELGPNVRDRDVTFIWTVGEELGLDGAAWAAKTAAGEQREPDYVFAIDTFVSSDSPLESKRFADARIGDGFVLRAVDNSNIVPGDSAEKLLRLARANHIPVQYGVTGGGNDGAAYLRYGAVDVALGWPLRYSHSPGEVVDTRDLDALTRIVTAISRSW